jgi:hypothetical protein
MDDKSYDTACRVPSHARQGVACMARWGPVPAAPGLAYLQRLLQCPACSRVPWIMSSVIAHHQTQATTRHEYLLCTSMLHGLMSTICSKHVRPKQGSSLATQHAAAVAHCSGTLRANSLLEHRRSSHLQDTICKDIIRSGGCQWRWMQGEMASRTRRCRSGRRMSSQAVHLMQRRLCEAAAAIAMQRRVVRQVEQVQPR